MYYKAKIGKRKCTYYILGPGEYTHSRERYLNRSNPLLLGLLPDQLSEVPGCRATLFLGQGFDQSDSGNVEIVRCDLGNHDGFSMCNGLGAESPKVVLALVVCGWAEGRVLSSYSSAILLLVHSQDLSIVNLNNSGLQNLDCWAQSESVIEELVPSLYTQ
jgi:hypothetical protein